MAEPYTLTPVVARETRTVRETAQILGIGERSAWSLTRQGRIRVLRLGKRVVVPTAEIDRLLGRDLPDRTVSNAEAR